jgi:hypothetical protein
VHHAGFAQVAPTGVLNLARLVDSVILMCGIWCFREELEEEPSRECEPLADLNLQVTPKNPQDDSNSMAGLDVNDVAYVRFVPSAKNPHPDYADELYFPPLDENTRQLSANDFAISNGELRL